MVRIKRRTEDHRAESGFPGEKPPAILFRKTFVLDANGGLIPPKEVRVDLTGEEAGDPDPSPCLECWECSDDVLAIEIVQTAQGNFYRLIYLPSRVSIEQVVAMDDILVSFDMHLSDRDYFFNSLKAMEFLINANEFNYQEEDENWPLYDDAEVEYLRELAERGKGGDAADWRDPMEVRGEGSAAGESAETEGEAEANEREDAGKREGGAGTWKLRTCFEYVEDPEFNLRDFDSPVLYRKVLAVDGKGHEIKPASRINCSVGDYPIPGSRAIYVEDWELPDDAAVFEVLFVRGTEGAYRIVSAKKGINKEQEEAIGFILHDSFELDLETHRDDDMVSETYRIAADHIPRIAEDFLVYPKPICGDDNLKGKIIGGDERHIPIRKGEVWVERPGTHY